MMEMQDRFYQDGGCLPPNMPSYITREADAELEKYLKDDNFCYILTARQMGKSSLRVNVSRKLEMQGFACASIDITQVGSKNLSGAESWYYTMLNIITRELKLPLNLSQWWKQNDNLTYLNRFFIFISEEVTRLVPSRVVIFLDEIDSILSIDNNIFNSDDFFAGIRALYNARATNPELNRINFVVIGVASPNELMNDPARTPFNIGKSVQLSNFTLEEASVMRDGLKKLHTDPAALLNEVFYWTSGQPVLTQKLCLSISQESPAVTDVKATVQEYVDRLFFDSGLGDSNNINLLYIQNRILEDDKHGLKMLDNYKQVLGKGSIRQIVGDLSQVYLKLTGLVRPVNGELKVNNRIYEHKLNDAWVEEIRSRIDRPFNAAMKEWVDSGKSETKALRESALQTFTDWCNNRNDLMPLEKEFQTFSHNVNIREQLKAQMEAVAIEKEKESQLKLAEERKLEDAIRLKTEEEKKKALAIRLQLEEEKNKALALAVRSEKRQRNTVISTIAIGLLLAGAGLFYLLKIRPQIQRAEAATKKLDIVNAKLISSQDSLEKLSASSSLITDSIRQSDKQLKLIQDSMRTLARGTQQSNIMLNRLQAERDKIAIERANLQSKLKGLRADSIRLAADIAAQDKFTDFSRTNDWIFSFDRPDQKKVFADIFHNEMDEGNYPRLADALKDRYINPNQSLNSLRLRNNRYNTFPPLDEDTNRIVKEIIDRFTQNQLFYKQRHILDTTTMADPTEFGDCIQLTDNSYLMTGMGFAFPSSDPADTVTLNPMGEQEVFMESGSLMGIARLNEQGKAIFSPFNYNGVIRNYCYSRRDSVIHLLSDNDSIYSFDFNGTLLHTAALTNTDVSQGYYDIECISRDVVVLKKIIRNKLSLYRIDTKANTMKAIDLNRFASDIQQWKGYDNPNHIFSYRTTLYSVDWGDIDVVYAPGLKKFIIVAFEKNSTLCIYTLDEKQHVEKISKALPAADLVNPVYGYMPEKEKMIIYPGSAGAEGAFIVLDVNNGNFKRVALPAELKQERVISISPDLQHFVLTKKDRGFMGCYNAANRTFKYIGPTAPCYFSHGSIISFFSKNAFKWDYQNTDTALQNLYVKYADPFFSPTVVPPKGSKK